MPRLKKDEHVNTKSIAALVTGGAGYIRSVMVEQLTARGEEVVKLDALLRGYRGAMSTEFPFYHDHTGNR